MMATPSITMRAFHTALAVLFSWSAAAPGRVCAAPIEWDVGSGGNGHLYEVVAAPGGISWDDAQLAAVAAGGYLATITSAEENTFVYGLVSGDPSLWIVDGANNTLGPWLGGIQAPGSPEPAGGFEWVTGEPFVYSNFLPGQPDNAFDNEEAIDFFGFGPDNYTPGWNDLPRDVPLVLAYVIESDPAGTTTTTTVVTTTTTTTPLDTVRFPAGTKLLVKQKKSGAQRLQLIARDAGIAAAMPCDVDGALVIEAAGAGAPLQTIDLDAALWSPIRAARPEKGCKYRKGPVVATVQLKVGKMLKVVAHTDDLGIPLATDPRPVRIEVRHGEWRHCFEFGGAKARHKPDKKLLARKALQATACPGD